VCSRLAQFAMSLPARSRIKAFPPFGNPMLRSRTCFLRTSSSRCRSTATLSICSTCSVNSTVSTPLALAHLQWTRTPAAYGGAACRKREARRREASSSAGLGAVANCSCSWLLNGLLFLFFTGQAPSSAARPPPNHGPASRRPRPSAGSPPTKLGSTSGARARSSLALGLTA
jgi:hypothetical protein